MHRHLITGTDDFDNLLQESPLDDLILAYGGNDNINAGAGNDLIYAGADNDYAIAGDGDDRAYGGDGADVVTGGNGNDTLYGSAGNDFVVGGTGIDWLYGGTDDDTIYSTHGSFGSEENHLFGGSGNDRLVVNANDSGTAAGGTGVDELSLTVFHDSGAGDAGVFVSLSGGNGTASTDGYLLTITGIEALWLQTSIGDDRVASEGGNDTILADGGANLVDSGGGDDRVGYTLTAANTLDGGLGLDTLDLTVALGQPALVFSAAGPVSDGGGSSLINFEQFIIHGNILGDSAVLGGLADQFFGMRGNDTARGGAGTDALRGQLGDDVLSGERGFDFLTGGDGNDVLDGGLGNDLLIGGLGSDLLTGGDGADRFRFASPEQYFDHITDFTQGSDHLVFSRALLGLTFDASPNDPGFLAINVPDADHGQFVFFGAGSSSPGELRWDADGTGFSGGVTIAILDGIDLLTTADFLMI